MYISKIKKASSQASVGKCRSTGQTGFTDSIDVFGARVVSIEMYAGIIH